MQKDDIAYFFRNSVDCCADCVQVDERNALWSRNSAGLSHSHQHGFGLMNAWRMVSTARVCCHTDISVQCVCMHMCTALV